jgi:hypothetical protein
MEEPFNPRIFLIMGIGNLILAGVTLAGCIVLLSMGGWRWSIAFVLPAIIFTQVGSLAAQQYRAMRALDAKFKKLEEGLGRRQELSAR